MTQPRPVQYAVFALIAAAYVAIRLWGMTASCLWFDEIFSIHAAEHSWDSLLSFVALDLIHPPLFYVLLKLWIGVGGESLFWLRSFPVLFSVIAIIPFILLCRELKLPFWTQILAFFFFAVNGSLIKYAQEVRMYSLLLCLSLFSMWFFVRYFFRGKSFVPLIIVNILLVYTHYFGWFMILSEFAAVLIFQRIKWRRMSVMFAIIFASFVPWIISIWQAAHSGSELDQNIGWMSRPGPKVIGQFVLNLVEPFYYQGSSAQPISIFKVSLPILLIAVIAVILYFTKWKDQNEEEKQSVKLLLVFIAMPLLCAFIMSWLLPYSIWGTRHLTIVFAPLSICLAIFLFKISNTTVGTTALTFIILFTGYAFVLESLRPSPQYSWCAWEPMAEAAARNDTNIYTFEDLVAYHIWFAIRKRPDSTSMVIKIRNVEGVREDKAYFLPRGFSDVPTVSLNDISETRFWVAYRGKYVGDPDPLLSGFIAKGYRLADQRILFADGENASFVLLQK